jgi:hypothetical protein
LDWFNVLIAQTLAHLRTEALHDDALLKSLSQVLNGPAKPDFVGPISVTEMALGEEFPIFSNCRIIPVDEAGVEVRNIEESTRLLARLDVDLSDAITLGVETKLLLNYPMPLAAVLPVALAVSVVRFSGTVRGLSTDISMNSMLIGITNSFHYRSYHLPPRIQLILILHLLLAQQHWPSLSYQIIDWTFPYDLYWDHVRVFKMFRRLHNSLKRKYTHG